MSDRFPADSDSSALSSDAPESSARSEGSPEPSGCGYKPLLLGFWRGNGQGIVAALQFMLPLPARARLPHERVWRSGAQWLVPLGFVAGLLWTGWFSFVWWKFGEIERIRIIPALTVVLLDVTFVGYRMFHGTILTIQEMLNPPRTNRKDSSGVCYQPSLPIVMAVIILFFLKFALIVSIPTTPRWWPSDWRQHLMWMYPETVYRPLLLAPMWAAWGLLLGAMVGRVSEQHDAPVAALARAITPTVVLSWFTLLTVITAIYCSHHGNIMVGVILSLIVLGTTFLASALVARKFGGQTEHSIYAAGQLAQLSFLTGFLAFGPYVFGA
jgi:hypothetical protein